MIQSTRVGSISRIRENSESLKTEKVSARFHLRFGSGLNRNFFQLSWYFLAVFFQNLNARGENDKNRKKGIFGFITVPYRFGSVLYIGTLVMLALKVPKFNRYAP